MLRVANHPVALRPKGAATPSVEEVKKALIEAIDRIPADDLRKFRAAQIQIIR
jgi:hypothetical protein